MEEKVEADVDYACVQEDGRYEAEPLVWLGLVVAAVFAGDVQAAETAEFGEGAGWTVAGGGGSAGAGPGDGFVHGGHAAHAGLVAGAHVDEDVGGGADHGVELRLDLDRYPG